MTEQNYNHSTEYKGTLSIHVIMSELVKREYKLFIPTTNSTPYDLIATKDFIKLLRVQVKHAVYTEGVMRCDLRTKHTNSSGTHSKSYNLDCIDYLAMYSSELNKICFISTSLLIGKQSISLRVDPTKNGQITGINWAKDFENVI